MKAVLEGRFARVLSSWKDLPMKLLLMAGAIVLALSAAAPRACAQGGTSPHATGSQRGVMQLQPGQMPATKLIGAAVYNSENAEIGTIKDLILEQDGHISAVVLSVGGFLGVGEKDITVPMSELTMGGSGRATLNMTKDQLAQVPTFEYSRNTWRSGPVTGPAGSSATGASGSSTTGISGAGSGDKAGENAGSIGAGGSPAGPPKQ
jgi:sporulation protein YlmC with PRC-barrel domain